MNKTDFINQMNAGFFDEKLSILYGRSNAAVAKQKERYKNAIGRFSEIFPNYEDIHIFSAPGRTEIGGNHTDHQHGCALAAAINLDIVAVIAFHEERTIRFFSEGYGMRSKWISTAALQKLLLTRQIGIMISVKS